MTESFELSANMVRPGTGLHADQTARNVHRVLADIDADRGDGGWH
jgi:hypothetical protein